MSMKISYSNQSNAKQSANIVLFVNEKFDIKNIKKYLSDDELFYISDLLKASDLKKNILIFKVSSKKKNYFNFN